MKIAITNLNDSIPLLLKNDVSFEALKKDYPDILADLVTFRSNPNCSCRGRVVKFFSEKLTASPGCLDKYIVNENEFLSELRSVFDKRLANNYNGKVFEIEKTVEAWERFAKETMNGKMFRAFSVVERENSIMVYFL